VRTFLTSREIIETAYFEAVQDHLTNSLSDLPTTLTLAKTHLFLASRYKPDLSLGVAAKSHYWPLEHKAFSEIRNFLQML
jgi:hypothetical protein